MKEINISIVIPTKNRAELLDMTLGFMQNQTIPKDQFELIVINNGSTDDTDKVCQKYEKVFPNFTYIYEETPGLHVGRNLGYQRARSDLLVYADDDIIVTDIWLESIWKGFQETKAVLIAGDCMPEYVAEPPEWMQSLWHDAESGARVLSGYSVVDFSAGGGARIIDPGLVYGCNYAIKKNILDKTGGFYPDIMPVPFEAYQGSGESGVSDYIKENGYESWYIPGASIRHMVTLERMQKEYPYKVAYRNGIFRMYTTLREKKLRGACIRICKDMIFYLMDPQKGVWHKKRFYMLKGKAFLLYSYMKSGRVRRWIHQKNYLNELGNVYARK